MNDAQLQAKLTELLALPAEIEYVEFKEAKNNFHFNDLGKYFSALSNEANLKSQEWAWLAFGVQDKPKQNVGTSYRPNRVDLDNLKEEIANQTNNRLTFEEIHEVNRPEGRVILFQIPPALKGMPTAWKGHYYGRDNEALVALSLHEIEQIRRQSVVEDWSEGICDGATIDDLDSYAIEFARTEFLNKIRSDPRKKLLVDEVPSWTDEEFLNRSKVCKNGQVTRTAILLLGKEESAHFLSPAVAQISWVLKDDHGIQQDYAHFGPPFILAVGEVFDRVRNLTYRYLPDATLFPVEVSQYDPWVTRELLHNCIAHQDYSQQGRINVVEQPHALLFTNRGKFLPGSVEAVITSDAPPDFYPNRFLVNAMVNLNMIDTIGSGIPRAFTRQRQRNFPMPTYDLSQPDRVEVCIPGQVLDPNYTRMLSANPDLDLLDVITLDKVQKALPISEFEARNLRAKKLVEGRRPNLHVSAKIARVTDTVADYLKKRGIDKEYCRRMIVEFLGNQPEASRQEIDGLLAAKLSDALDETQKKNFITNLLQEMRRDGTLVVEGTTRWAKWRLA